MNKLVMPLLFLAVSAVYAHTDWKLDRAHSNVRFIVTHLVISEVEGNFDVYDGTINSDNENDFSGADINFTVDVKSINTNNDKRDNHLKSDDFFNAEKYPQMNFKSTSFKKESDDSYSLYGDLTIRDVTKPVKFDVEYKGKVKDGYGNIKAAFKASTVLNRFDYGLKWNALIELGGAVVGEDVKVVMNLQFSAPEKVVGDK